MTTKRRLGNGLRFLHHMGRSSPKMLAGLLIRGTTPSALNVKWIDIAALCHQSRLITPATVGFPPHMMNYSLCFDLVLSSNIIILYYGLLMKDK